MGSTIVTQAHTDMEIIKDQTQKLTINNNEPENSRVNSDAKIQKIKLPDPRDKGKLAFTYTNLLSDEESAHLIKLSETEIGYSKPDTKFYKGRDNWRAERVSPAFAQTIFERIRDELPEYWYDQRKNGQQTKWKLVGLNEFFRFYRYDPGNYFQPHKDGVYKRHYNSSTPSIKINERAGERSFITFIVYLNGDFEGGATTFYESIDFARPASFYRKEVKNPVHCVPETGKALVFQHDILHEGSTLIKGQKYAFRTDVMYAPVNKGKGNTEIIPKTYSEKPLPIHEENGGIGLEEKVIEMKTGPRDLKLTTKGEVICPFDDY